MGELARPDLYTIDANPFGRLPGESTARTPVESAVMGTLTAPYTAIKNLMDVNRDYVDARYYGSGGDVNRLGTKLAGEALNAATLPMGTGAIAGVPVRAGEVALAAGAARPRMGALAEMPPARPDFVRYNYAGDVVGNAGKAAPTNPFVQTVDQPYRMMYPGIYRDPREIAATAATRVAPENPAMKQLWGVSRADLEDIGRGRVGADVPPVTGLAERAKGSASAQGVMTPRNEQRLIDVLTEAGKYPGLAHADAWYVMDPMYRRLAEMFGPEEAAARYRALNTQTGMASPGSDVLTEIQRGTAAHWLAQQGRWEDFVKYGGMKEASRGAGFPEDMRYIGGHPYHMTSQVLPMRRYLDTGVMSSDAPKVPSYVLASGVPETGFQTRYAVGDAHYSRGIGLADTRKGPTDVQASWSPQEYQTLSPWWREKVAAPAGLEAVPAQARLWTALGPQTGVDSPLGQGKLELFSQQIMKAAKRLGVTPETARDLILSGKAGAGVLAGTVGLGSLAAQDRYQLE